MPILVYSYEERIRFLRWSIWSLFSTHSLGILRENFAILKESRYRVKLRAVLPDPALGPPFRHRLSLDHFLGNALSLYSISVILSRFPHFCHNLYVYLSRILYVTCFSLHILKEWAKVCSAWGAVCLFVKIRPTLRLECRFCVCKYVFQASTGKKQVYN
jgi:hypothetical protein